MSFFSKAWGEISEKVGGAITDVSNIVEDVVEEIPIVGDALADIVDGVTDTFASLIKSPQCAVFAPNPQFWMVVAEIAAARKAGLIRDRESAKHSIDTIRNIATPLKAIPEPLLKLYWNCACEAAFSGSASVVAKQIASGVIKLGEKTSIWPNGSVYFFKRSAYVRYNVGADKTDDGYPKPIHGNWPGFPPEFESGIDSFVKWNDGKAFVFRGSDYLRYDIAGDKVDAGYPQPIARRWPGLWSDGIDAGAIWPTKEGKAYFFRGSMYARYDVAGDKVDLGYPRPIAGNWPGFPPAFEEGIDGVAVWSKQKAYFFRGDKYLRYDIPGDKVDSGYPRTIASSWPGLWDDGIDA